MTAENRRRLIALVAAAAKLDAAARLAKEAIGDVSRSGLLPVENAQAIAVDLDRYLHRINLVIEKIPS